VIAARLGTLEASTISLEGDNPSMTLADAQQQRPLERRREAGDEAVACAELHDIAIAFPAAVVSELELNGYVIKRVYDHGRLIGVRPLQPEPRTRSPPGSGARIDSQRPRIPLSRLVRAQAARRGEGAPVHIIVRAVQSSVNGRSCRSASVDWVVSAPRPSARSAPNSPARPTGAAVPLAP